MNNFRVLACILVVSVFLYLYTDRQNNLTKVRFLVPKIASQIKTIREENKRLQYEIDQFESPAHLMELARQSEYCHLRYPLVKEVMNCEQGLALQSLPQHNPIASPSSPKATLATVP